MQTLWLAAALVCGLPSVAQKADRFRLEAGYGAQANFFVSTYNDVYSPGNSSTYFRKKDPIGTMAATEAHFRLGRRSFLSAGFARSVNSARVDFSGTVGTAQVDITGFHLRHLTHFFTLGYARAVERNRSEWQGAAGLVYLTTQQQEFELDRATRDVMLNERNFSRNRLAEGGVYGGVQYLRRIDSRFRAGVKLRVYYLVSVASFETLALTPTLTFSF